MYTNTGYMDLKDEELENLNLPLRVNCSGLYRPISRPSMTTFRPFGRPDHQIIYIASGKAWFKFTDNLEEVPSGSMVYLKPLEYQEYTYYLKDKPEACWVHFTGFLADSLLEYAGFKENKILHTGISSKYQELFLSMIRELQLPRPCQEELSTLYLRELFLLLKRQKLEGSFQKSEIQKEMEAAVHFFHENYTSDIVIEDYARKLHMSTCWFIRCFRQYTGMPPRKYLTAIRIRKAVELLESTHCKAGEIGAIVGYENPLYFSRIFKSQTGLSPSQYRKAAAGRTT